MGRTCSLFLLSLLLFAIPASSASAATPRVAAEQALQEAREALDGGGDVTAALGQLADAAPALDALDRQAARKLLARPTDSPAGPANPDDAESGADYRVAEHAPLCSPRFCVHFVTSTEDAPVLTDTDLDGFPNYVERALAVFEEVYVRENGPAASGGLGWPAAPSDGARGSGPQVDVYLADIGDKNLYGYVAPDVNQSAKSQTSYQVMDDDYAEFDGDQSLRVTAAHEYNHVLQYGINAESDAWAGEAIATWMEEKVYPDINDYFQYLEPWATGVGFPLTSFVGGGPQENFQYGSAVWDHYLESRFGEDIVRDTYVQSQAGEDFLQSHDRTLGTRGTSFRATFGNFAAAVAEWRSAPARFPDNAGYPDATRAGPTLTLGSTRSLTLDHASFKLYNVAAAGQARIRLEAASPAGRPGVIALVGRPGNGGPVVERVVDVPAGGGASVTLDNATGFGRITAVLVNADRRHGAFNDNAEDWNWTGNGTPVNARVVAASSTTPPPVVPTQPVAPDRTAPNVRPRIFGKGKLRRGRLQVRVTCPATEEFPCTASASAKGRFRGQRRASTLGTAKRVRLPAGESRTIGVRFSRRALRNLRRTKRVTVAVSVRVTDSAGNGSLRTLRVRVRR